MILIREESVLLLRRKGTGFCDGMYSVPAGHVEPCEDVLDAAIRELREETDLNAHRDNIRIAGVGHRRSQESRIDFFVLVDRWTGSLKNLEPAKCDDLSFRSMANLPSPIIPYVQSAIERVAEGTGDNQIWFDSATSEEATGVEPAQAYGYDAFVSFSVDQSESIARQFYLGLSKIGKPPWKFWTWYQSRVFFDQEEIRIGDRLSDKIRNALIQSKYLVLLACPETQESEWVNLEVTTWLEKHPVSRLLIVVLDGDVEWDGTAGDFDWDRTNCIPHSLCGRYTDQHWEDARTQASGADQQLAIRQAIHSVAAKILDIEDEQLRKVEKSQLRVFWSTVLFTAACLVIVAGASLYNYLSAISGIPADQHYNRGRELLGQRRNSSQVQAALRRFEQALEHDPNHVPSLIASAEARILLVGLGGSEFPDRDLREAEACINLAEKNNGGDRPDYLMAKGQVLLYGNREILEARKFFRHAADVDESNLTALQNVAYTHTFLQDHENAIRISREAVDYLTKQGQGKDDPRYIRCKVNFAWTLYHAREYEAAETQCKDILAVDPTSDHANRYLGHIYTQMGQYAKALDRYRRAGGDNLGVNRNLFANYSCALALGGAKDEAEYNLRQIEQSNLYYSPYRLAQAYSSLGRYERALELLVLAKQEHDPFILWSATDPLMTGLTGDRRYESFLESIGLAATMQQP